EYEIERVRGPRATVERLDGVPPVGADGAVHAPECEHVRRVVLGDLVGHLLLAATDLARLGGSGADPGGAAALDLRADDLLLPLAVRCKVVEIGKHVLRAPRDLNALPDGHALPP